MHEFRNAFHLSNTATVSVLIRQRNPVLRIKKSLRAILIKQLFSE